MATTHYARSGEVHVAYQVLGEGPDLVFVPGWISHVEACWDFPPLARFLERLASFSRLILVDKRGTGLSDPLPFGSVATLEDRMDDIRAVMDAVGSARATLLGISEGGPLNMLFAATYPERTAGLILLGSFARASRAADHPDGVEVDRLSRYVERVRDEWGGGMGLAELAPSVAEDAGWRDGWARYQRMAASPGVAAALLALNVAIDVRHVLPTIRVPTLVLHRRDERFVPVALGRQLAERIPDARLIELPGGDHLYFAGDTDQVLDEIEEFLTGTRSVADDSRVLATVLFTDIVGSTEHATRLGDARWRDLLDQHDAFTRRQLGRFRGRAVKTTGDGVVAVFDGPARALRCAAALAAGVRSLGLEIRAGVHSGECEMRGDDVAGIAVHIAARVAQVAGAGEVLCTGTVRDLVAGSGLAFSARGSHALRGVAGEWLLWAAG